MNAKTLYKSRLTFNVKIYSDSYLTTQTFNTLYSWRIKLIWEYAKFLWLLLTDQTITLIDSEPYNSGLSLQNKYEIVYETEYNSDTLFNASEKFNKLKSKTEEYLWITSFSKFFGDKTVKLEIL